MTIRIRRTTKNKTPAAAPSDEQPDNVAGSVRHQTKALNAEPDAEETLPAEKATESDGRRLFRSIVIKALTISLICLGLMLAIQYKTQQVVLSDLSQQSEETLVTLIRQLYDKQYQLTVERLDLNEQLAAYRESSEQEDSQAETLHNEIKKMAILNGTSAVEGPGLVINIESPISAEDLIEIINDLWNSGAEAISVNDVRFTNYSNITDLQATKQITMDKEVLSPPYIIKAIGDPDTLNRGIQIPGGIIDELVVYYNMEAEIMTRDDLELPAARYTAPQFSYAKKYQAESNETDQKK